MRQAIVTKYIGPTNFRGARIKATAQVGSITLSWDDAHDVDDNHLRAALALAAKHGWIGPGTGTKLVGGGNPSGNGNVYVMVQR